MASKYFTTKIDKEFLICALCLEEIDNPRGLPCLHRFCLKCLKRMVEVHHGVLNCPLCRKEAVVPEGGVEGFAVDYITLTLKGNLKIREGFKSKPSGECNFCGKNQDYVAFCSTCSFFICNDCNQIHLL